MCKECMTISDDKSLGIWKLWSLFLNCLNLPKLFFNLQIQNFCRFFGHEINFVLSFDQIINQDFIWFIFIFFNPCNKLVNIVFIVVLWQICKPGFLLIHEGFYFITEILNFYLVIFGKVGEKIYSYVYLCSQSLFCASSMVASFNCSVWTSRSTWRFFLSNLAISFSVSTLISPFFVENSEKYYTS